MKINKHPDKTICFFKSGRYSFPSIYLEVIVFFMSFSDWKI